MRGKKGSRLKLILGTLLFVGMLFGSLPAAAFASEGGTQEPGLNQGKPDGDRSQGQGDGGQGSGDRTTVDHIDIGVNVTAEIVYNGEERSQDITLAKSDFTSNNVTITAVQGGQSVEFTPSFDRIEDSSGKSGVAQWRIPGTYPVGTNTDPVKYTVKLVKDVTFKISETDQITIPITFESTFSYYDEDNDCPGLKDKDRTKVHDGAGMDFILGTGKGSVNYYSIQKNVVLDNGDGTTTPLAVTDYTATFDFYADGTSINTNLQVNVAGVGIGYGTKELDNTTGAISISESDPAGTVVVDGITYSLEKTTIQAGDGSAKEITEDNPRSDGLTSGGKFIVTNYYKESEPKTTRVSGTKYWEDADDVDKLRPQSITINLYGNDEYVKSTTVAADEDGEWKYSFEDLPICGEDGNEIVYTVKEEAIDGYTAAYDGYDIYNRHDPAAVSVSVEKIWEDADDQDGKRPDSVTVYLVINGEKTEQKLVLNESNNWRGSFDDLPAYGDQQAVVYTVSEDSVSGYTTKIEKGTDGTFIITNTHEPETTKVSGTKTWVGDTEETRPESITVNLLANGTKKASKTVTAKTQWKYSFKNLPKYENGKEITYTVTEDAVEDYTASVDGSNIKNTYTPGRTSVSVTKSWKDDNNKDGLRPESVTITLFANGKSTGKTLELNENNKWSGQFTDLAVKENGETIVYTVSEEQVSGYEKPFIIGSAAEGFVVTNTHTTKTTPPKDNPTPEPTPDPTPDPITNTTNVAVGKVWADENNADGIRPSSVTVQLYRNGEAYGNPVTLSDDNAWWYRWDHLDASANWTVDELNVADGYTKSFTKNAVNAWVIVNTHEVQNTVTAAAADTPTGTAGGESHTNAYTGDESHMFLWAALMIASGIGAAIVIVRRRRRS